MLLTNGSIVPVTLYLISVIPGTKTRFALQFHKPISRLTLELEAIIWRHLDL